MIQDEKYLKRLTELRPLIFCLKSAIELFGRDKALQLARLTLEKYADNRFVTPYENIPMEKRWQTFRDDVINCADDIEYSIKKYDENTVKVKYKRCIFYQIFKEYGLEDFVPIYCQTDYTTCKKIHPDMSMTRTQTIAEGAPYCDHEWSCKSK